MNFSLMRTICVIIFYLMSMNVVYAENSILKQSEKPKMKFNQFAYIFLGPGLDAKKDRAEIKTANFTFTTVGIDFQHKEQVVAVAKELIANGAQMIELCGGFGPLWIAKVSEATQGKVPVGSVAYGPEARRPLLDLLSPESKG